MAHATKQNATKTRAPRPLTVAKMAARLHLTNSRVYSLLDEFQIEPIEKRGRSQVYDPSALQAIKDRPRQHRRDRRPMKSSENVSVAKQLARMEATIKELSAKLQKA